MKTLSASVRLLAETIGQHILGLNQSSSALFGGSLVCLLLLSGVSQVLQSLLPFLT